MHHNNSLINSSLTEMHGSATHSVSVDLNKEN